MPAFIFGAAAISAAVIVYYEMLIAVKKKRASLSNVEVHLNDVIPEIAENGGPKLATVSILKKHRHFLPPTHQTLMYYNNDRTGASELANQVWGFIHQHPNTYPGLYHRRLRFRDTELDHPQRQENCQQPFPSSSCLPLEARASVALMYGHEQQRIDEQAVKWQAWQMIKESVGQRRSEYWDEQAKKQSRAERVAADSFLQETAFGQLEGLFNQGDTLESPPPVEVSLGVVSRKHPDRPAFGAGESFERYCDTLERAADKNWVIGGSSGCYSDKRRRVETVEDQASLLEVLSRKRPDRPASGPGERFEKFSEMFERSKERNWMIGGGIVSSNPWKRRRLELAEVVSASDLQGVIVENDAGVFDRVDVSGGGSSIVDEENEEELVDVVSGGGLQGEDGSGVLDMDDGVDVDVDSGGGGEMDEEDEEVVMEEPKPLRRSSRIALLPQVDYSLSRRATRLRRSPRLAKLKRVNYKE